MDIKKEQIDELYKAVMACDIGDIYEVAGVRHEPDTAIEAVRLFDKSHAQNIEDVNKALDLVRALFTT